MKSRRIRNKFLIIGSLLLVGSSHAATGAGSTTFAADMRDYTLVVASEHGSPSPSIGTNSIYCWHSQVNCSVVENGWNCTGWSGTSSIPSDGGTTNVTATLTNLSSSITWNWREAKTYTVTYDAKGGVVSPASNSVTYAANYGTLPTPTRTVYTFDGWWSGDNGTGTEVTSETMVSTASNHTLYARWTLVSNVSATQVPGTKTVEISYDVTSTETNVMGVWLVISDGTQAVACPSVSGDVGAGVATGTGKIIVWDMGTDWNGDVATLSATVKTYDGVGFLPGGDPTAVAWEMVDLRWVKNYYADGAITMSDRDTSLMWMFDADASGTANWDTATSRCSGLVYAGHDDWFLPNSSQLHTLYNQKSVFKGVQSSRYWSSTRGSNYAYWVDMSSGNVNVALLDRAYWVWPCRSGQ